MTTENQYKLVEAQRLLFAALTMNRLLVERFMELAHQQHTTAYYTDALIYAISITCLSPGEVRYISFAISGSGIYSTAAKYVDEVAEIEICKDIHKYSRGIIYRFVGGECDYTVIDRYHWA